MVQNSRRCAALQNKTRIINCIINMKLIETHGIFHNMGKKRCLEH